MSQRSTWPSPLVSTISATSGMTMLPGNSVVPDSLAGSVHVHLMTGSNELGGAGGCVQVGALSDPLSGGTWQTSTGPVGASLFDPSPTRLPPSCGGA